MQEVAKALEHQQEARFAEALAMARRLGTSWGTSARVGKERGGLEALEVVEPGPRIATLEELGRELEQHLAEHRTIPYISEERSFRRGRTRSRGRSSDTASDEEPAEERAYFDFEVTFRGPEARVLDLQRAYMPLLMAMRRCSTSDSAGASCWTCCASRDRGPGSGYGRRHGRPRPRQGPRGGARRRKRVSSGVEPGALGAIVALEVVEHIPYESLMEFLKLAHSRLRQDGLLLFETVNPHAVHAMKAFWVDPTHQHPIFPEVALELCRLSGFGKAFWFHPTGRGEFEVDRNGQAVYAVAARS